MHNFEFTVLFHKNVRFSLNYFTYLLTRIGNHMMVAWVLASWRMVSFYECLGGRCGLHLQGDGNYARQTLMWLGRKNGTFIQDASWVICQLRGNVPYLKWRRLTEHLYQNLNGYVENDAKEMWFSCGYTYCTRLTWCYPYTAQVRPWADR